jgi:hypothetical protein
LAVKIPSVNFYYKITVRRFFNASFAHYKTNIWSNREESVDKILKLVKIVWLTIGINVAEKIRIKNLLKF